MINAITKVAGFLLQSRTVSLQNMTAIRNVTTLLQNVTFFVKCLKADVIMFYFIDVSLHRCYNANHKDIRFVSNGIQTIM